MATATAFQTQYRQEFIKGFEQRQSLMRSTTTTEAVIKGNTATFLVADSGGATATTRGVNGLIPARNNSLTQTSATLAEWHDLVQITRFNIFASQGDQNAIMQDGTMAVINRKIDSDILTALATGTQDTGAAQTMSLNLAMRAKVILGNNQVPFDGNIFAIISPAAEAYLMQIAEFASSDYVGSKPFDGNTNPQMLNFRRWMGINWMVHPNLSGVGTSAEKCFMFHKSAIGHAVDTAGIQSPVGYNEEQDYSWARASAFMGSVVLQNDGIVVINHDGSEYVSE
jgi:hypothetical protein